MLKRNNRSHVQRAYWRSVKWIAARYKLTIPQARSIKRESVNRNITITSVVKKRRKISRGLKKYWKKVRVRSKSKGITVKEARQELKSFRVKSVVEPEAFFVQDLETDLFGVVDYIDGHPGSSVDLLTDFYTYRGKAENFNGIEFKEQGDLYYENLGDSDHYWRLEPFFRLQHFMNGLIRVRQVS